MIGVILTTIFVLLLIYAINNNSTSSDKSDEIIFKSAFTRGGSIIVPETLIFDNDKVTWVKNHGLDYLYLNKTTTTITYKNVVGINVERNIIGCNIQIIGKGFQSIYARNFTNDDATKIELIINEVMTHFNKK